MGAIDNFVHLFAPLTANCREFGAKWDHGVTQTSDGVSGCWEGEWISSATGHRGRLRCVISPLAPDRWRMSFRAEYSAIFRACYATDFNVHRDGDRWTFEGGSDLGALAGGAYTYSGHAACDSLVCSYRSARDHGEFRLSRYRGTP